MTEYDPPTLRLLRLALVLVAAACAWPAAASSNELEPGPQAPSTRVGIFYYPWFANPTNDGRYMHWQQGGMQPPSDVASSFYPVRGVYSSADSLVVDAQMREIAAAGIGVVITSWWGRSSREDRRLPQLLGAARRHGLSVAAHLEPYRGRTVESTEADIGYLRGLGISDCLRLGIQRVPRRRVGGDERANPGRPRVREHKPRRPRCRRGLRRPLHLRRPTLRRRALPAPLPPGTAAASALCAPSVGPGYDARRATADVRIKPRRDGARYDGMWRGAVRAGADLVTVTSYNEWHEGTQIEPARSDRSGYESYEGAWGLHGRAAETAYLDRTAFWVQRLMRR